jgi:hypothetical protein
MGHIRDPCGETQTAATRESLEALRLEVERLLKLAVKELEPHLVD